MQHGPLSTRPSPSKRRVGVCIDSFEACSDFTRVTVRWIARPPKVAFVTRLRPGQLPNRAARQLPDQIDNSPDGEPSSIDDARLRGALLPASKPSGSIEAPLFCALDALTVDNRHRRAGLAPGQLPVLGVKRVMDAIQCPVMVPAPEIRIHRAARRQVLRQRPPLAARTQDKTSAH